MADKNQITNPCFEGEGTEPIGREKVPFSEDDYQGTCPVCGQIYVKLRPDGKLSLHSKYVKRTYGQAEI